MRALRQHSWNGPEDLRLVDVEPPTPGPGEILVRVAAAGVNFADVMQTYGTYGGGPRPPYLAGFEAAGEVVDGPAAGATVVGTGYGAFAEYMTMPAAAAAPVPAGWTGEQALGLVLNWATALAALRTLGRLAPGETVLVHAAAGGVGQAAVRLARHYGATVLGIASPAKHAAVRAAGADDVLDPSADLAAEARRRTGGRGADLVLESVGGPAFAASLAAARRITGRVVVLGEAGGEAAVTNRRLVFDDQVQVMGLHIGVLARAEPELYAGLLDE
ncbi:MAG TPA: zinc-binding dehydrogenase [Dactylosporangium sp.]|nr:zinc-binding dehydrogenase [Dactylosporangium sp.]